MLLKPSSPPFSGFMESSSPPLQLPTEISACKLCGQPPEEAYTMALCADCRTKLTRPPFPLWIIAASVLILLLLVYSMTQAPAAITAAVAFERGRKDEARREYREAEQEYKKVVTRFPESTEAVARLGISAWRAGDPREAAQAFESLEGRQASKELTAEVNGVISEMEARLK